MAKSFREQLLGEVEDIRRIPGDLDLRRVQVWVVRTVYSGSRVGAPGASSQVTRTRILVGGHNPKVRQVQARDLVAGASALVVAEWEVGPITPEQAGMAPHELTPEQVPGGPPTTVQYLLKGPGFPDTGLICVKIGDSTTQNFRYTLRLRAAGRAGART